MAEAFIPEVLDFEELTMTEEARNAFAVYCAGGGRSAKETAQLLDIPAGTVRSWAARYRWSERLRNADADTRKEQVLAAVAVASAQHQLNIRAAMDIRDDPSVPAVARLRAIEWLSGIGGLVPAKTGTVPMDSDGPEDTGSDLSQAELDEMAKSGNVAGLLRLARGERLAG